MLTVDDVAKNSMKVGLIDVDGHHLMSFWDERFSMDLFEEDTA